MPSDQLFKQYQLTHMGKPTSLQKGDRIVLAKDGVKFFRGEDVLSLACEGNHIDAVAVDLHFGVLGPVRPFEMLAFLIASLSGLTLKQSDDLYEYYFE